MPIQIVDGGSLKASTVVAVIYGPPSVGKTSLAFTAQNPILFDFDGNAFKASNRSGKAVVAIEKWADLEGLTAEDVKPYGTIIVDTVGTCLDKLAASIIAGDSRKGSGGALTLQGYGALKARFKTWLDAVRSYGKDVVLIAHGAEENRDDRVVDRIVAAGGSKQEIYQQATIMGRFFATNEGRTLSFDPTSSSYGKNVGLPDYIVREPVRNPDILATILKDVKRNINDMADDDEAEHQRLQGLRTYIEGLDGAQAFNGLLAKMVSTDAGATDRKILVEIGEAKDLVWDRKAKHFADPVPTLAPTEDDAREAPF